MGRVSCSAHCGTSEAIAPCVVSHFERVGYGAYAFSNFSGETGLGSEGSFVSQGTNNP